MNAKSLVRPIQCRKKLLEVSEHGFLMRDTIIFPKVGGALLTNKRRLLVRETCIDNNLMGCVVRGADVSFAFYMLQKAGPR